MEKQKNSYHNELIVMIGMWDRRLRQQQITFWLARTLLIGLTLAILITISVRFFPWLSKDQEIIAMLLSVIGSIVIMWATFQFWPRPLIKSAQYFDNQFDLQERVSTALELASGRISTANELASHQLEDAHIWAKAINVKEKLPLTANVGEWVAVVWLVIILVVFLVFGNMADAASEQNSSQRLAIADAADKIEETIKDIAADTDIDAVTRGELLEELKNAQTTLEDEDITAEEASATINDLENLLRDESSELREQIAEQEAAAEALREPGDETPLDDLLAPQGLEKFDEAASAEEMASALEQAAAALEATDPELAQTLRDAAQALREGDMEAAQETLERAEQLMEEAQRKQQQMEQASESMEQAAEQMEQASDEIMGPTESGQQGVGVPGMGAEGEAESGDMGQNSQTGEEEGGQADALSNEEGETGQQGNPNPDEQSEDGGVPLSQSSSASEQSSSTGLDTGDLESQGTTDIGQEHEYEEIFAPTRPDVEAGNDEIQLQPDEGDTLVRQGDLAEDAEGRSTVPYNQVFSNYADEVNSALDQSYVPLGLRDVVREYFTSLAPNGD